MTKKPRKILLTVVKLLVAATLLVWVLSGVHWRNYVQAKDGKTEYELATSVEGGSTPRTLNVLQGRLWWAKQVQVNVNELKPISESDSSVVRKGFVSILVGINKLLLGLACAGFVTSVLVTAVRWWFLLRLLDIHISVWEAVRLTFLGQFFNTIVPGTVGGDLVKAYYVARHTPKKAQALVCIFVDRVLGMTELTLLASVMLVVVLIGGLAPRENLRVPMLTVPIVVLILACAFTFIFSSRVRRLLHLQKLYNRLPIAHHFAAAGEAAQTYRRRLGSLVKAVMITFGGHIVWIGSISLIGMSLGLQTRVFNYFLYVPLVYIIGAVPLTPGGVGLVEALYVSFFAPVAPTEVLALALLARLIPVFWGLPGALVAVTGPKVPKTAAMEAELGLTEDAPTDGGVHGQ